MSEFIGEVSSSSSMFISSNAPPEIAFFTINDPS